MIPHPGQRFAAQVGLGVVQKTRGREDQCEREVGGAVVEHAGRVAHDDSVLACRRDVDVVVADRDVGDDLQPGSRARRQHAGVDAVGEHAHDAVDVTRVRTQLFRSERRVVGIGADELVRGERIQPAVGKPAGDQNPTHRLVLGVVDRARAFDADGEAEAVDRRVVAHRPEAVHRVRRDVHEVALRGSRAPRRRSS